MTSRAEPTTCALVTIAIAVPNDAGSAASPFGVNLDGGAAHTARRARQDFASSAIAISLRLLGRPLADLDRDFRGAPARTIDARAVRPAASSLRNASTSWTSSIRRPSSETKTSPI